MRTLPPPGFLVADVMQRCAQGLRDAELGARYIAALPVIEAAAEVYALQGAQARWYTIESSDEVGGMTRQEMEQLYSRRFVRSAATRHIYGALKSACTNDICPLCGQRTVQQLDHYLPVTRHPAFAVTPINLVPACGECNKAKLARTPAAPQEQTLHPYFDDITQVRWLHAAVLETVPASVLFTVQLPEGTDAIQKARIELHFEVFDLGALYAAHAAEEISNIRYGLGLLGGGVDAAGAIREHLALQAHSRAHVQPNSWQAASYEAMAASAWFCAGGYSL